VFSFLKSKTTLNRFHDQVIECLFLMDPTFHCSLAPVCKNNLSPTQQRNEMVEFAGAWLSHHAKGFWAGYELGYAPVLSGYPVLSVTIISIGFDFF